LLFSQGFAEESRLFKGVAIIYRIV